MLFLHDKREKVTLFMLVPLQIAFVAAFFSAASIAGVGYQWTVGIAVFVAMLVALHFLICAFPPLLWKSVHSGLIHKPDMLRLWGLVCSYAGWQENWTCQTCGYDLRAVFGGYDFLSPPPDRCPKCGAELERKGPTSEVRTDRAPTDP